MTIYVPGKSIAFIYILEKGDSKMAGYDWKDRFEEQYYDPQDSRYRDRQAYPETEDERYYERQPYDRRDRRGYYPADRYDIERDYYDRAPRYERRYYDDRYPYYQDQRDYELRDRYEREDRERLYQDRRYYRDEDWRDDRYLRYRRDDLRTDDPRYEDRAYPRREPSYRERADEFVRRYDRNTESEQPVPVRQEYAEPERGNTLGTLTDEQRSEIESFVLRLLAENNIDVSAQREPGNKVTFEPVTEPEEKKTAFEPEDAAEPETAENPTEEPVVETVAEPAPEEPVISAVEPEETAVEVSLPEQPVSLPVETAEVTVKAGEEEIITEPAAEAVNEVTVESEHAIETPEIVTPEPVEAVSVREPERPVVEPVFVPAEEVKAEEEPASVQEPAAVVMEEPEKEEYKTVQGETEYVPETIPAEEVPSAEEVLVKEIEDRYDAGHDEESLTEISETEQKSSKTAEAEMMPEEAAAKTEEIPAVSEDRSAQDDIIRRITQTVIDEKKEAREPAPDLTAELAAISEELASETTEPDSNVEGTVENLFSDFEEETPEQNEPIHIPFDEEEMRSLVSEIESEPKSEELNFALESETEEESGAAVGTAEPETVTVPELEELISGLDEQPAAGSESQPEEKEEGITPAAVLAGTAAIVGIEEAIENVKEQMDEGSGDGLKEDIDSIESALRDLIAKLRSGKEEAIREFDSLDQEKSETPELITDFGLDDEKTEISPDTSADDGITGVPDAAGEIAYSEPEIPGTPSEEVSEQQENISVEAEAVAEEPINEQPAGQDVQPEENVSVQDEVPAVTETAVPEAETVSEAAAEVTEPEAAQDLQEPHFEDVETVSESVSEGADDAAVQTEAAAPEIGEETEISQEYTETEDRTPVAEEQKEIPESVSKEEHYRTDIGINELADTFEFTPISVDGQGNIYTSGGFNFDLGSEPVRNIPGQLKFDGNEVVEEDAQEDQKLEFVLSEIDSIETSLLKGAVLELYEKQLLSPQIFSKDNCFEVTDLVSDEVLRFGNSPMIRLFNGVSFRIPKGARTAITGKEENSRAALTRTLGTGSGILSGTVIYGGKELSSKQWASSVMYIDSGDVISDSMTGTDFLMLCGIPQKMIGTVLSRTGMAGAAAKTADKMSDVQKVILLVIAGALSDSVSTIVINLNDVKVTEAEETCFALAGEFVTEFGKTLIMNAFSRHCAAAVCDYVIAIDNGSLAYEGDIKGFADAYGDDRLTFLCRDEMLQGLREKLPEFVITSKNGVATLAGTFDRERLEQILDVMLSEDIDLAKVSAEPRNFITATEGM